MSKAIHENSTLSYIEQKVRGRTEGFRRAVFRLLCDSSDPMTDRELMESLKEADCNNVRPEVTRLKEDGLIYEVDKVRCAVTGKTVRRTKPTGKPYFPRGHKPADPDFKVENNQFYFA